MLGAAPTVHLSVPSTLTTDNLIWERFMPEIIKRMAMNDEETVALIAGGHIFGKNH